MCVPYGTSKVFQGVGDIERSLSCNGTVVNIWLTAMCGAVLGAELSAALQRVQVVSTALPLGRSQLLEVVDMLEDIRSLRREALGEQHPSVGDCCLAAGLALVHVGGEEAAARGAELIAAALASYPPEEVERVALAHSAAAAMAAA